MIYKIVFIMNALKTKIRNRLEEDHLDLRMRIESYHLEGGLIRNKPCRLIIDLDRVYSEWINAKDRKEKL